MAAIDFPNTPTDGQEFSASGRTWVWNDTLGVWETVSAGQASTQNNVDPNIFLLMGA
jgi:hypothetical protein